MNRIYEVKESMEWRGVKKGMSGLEMGQREVKGKEKQEIDAVGEMR